jgi:hypothetical protein
MLYILLHDLHCGIYSNVLDEIRFMVWRGVVNKKIPLPVKKGVYIWTLKLY